MTWTPCSDRLPDDDSPVLCYGDLFGFGPRPYIGRCTVSGRPTRPWVIQNPESHRGVWAKSPPTLWAPLPPSPERTDL